MGHNTNPKAMTVGMGQVYVGLLKGVRVHDQNAFYTCVKLLKKKRKKERRKEKMEECR